MSDFFGLDPDLVDFLKVLLLVLCNFGDETLFERIVLALVQVFLFSGDCITRFLLV